MSTESSPPNSDQTKLQTSGDATLDSTSVAVGDESSSSNPKRDADETAGEGRQDGVAGQASETAPTSVEAAPTEDLEAERVSVELVDVKAPHAPPPPRSMRPKQAKEFTSPPLGVTAQLPAPVWPPRTVADLMTRKILTVSEQDPIGNLEELMEQFRFRHLPVVEAGMKLVGLITRTDLLHAELGRKPDGTPAPKVGPETLAGVIMRRNVVFAQLDTPIATISKVMLENKLNCIPVVLEDHTLVGIVTESDLVGLALHLLDPKE